MTDLCKKLEKITGIPADRIDRLAKEVSWLRETMVRITPAVEGITRGDADAVSDYYASIVAACLVALGEGGVNALNHPAVKAQKDEWNAKFTPDPMEEHAPRSASEFI